VHPILAQIAFAVVALTGTAGWVVLWLRRGKVERLWNAAFILVILISLVGLASAINFWTGEGAYPNTEFELTFEDQAGKPVRGVQLLIDDQGGRPLYHYPITDYEPGNTPTSNEIGVMVFHHSHTGWNTEPMIGTCSLSSP
jgi:hypothetical protein